jgi:hypothetical protein
MRVKHLLILSFGATDDPKQEVRGSVNALAKKYGSRPEVLSVWHYPSNIDGGTVEWGEPEPKKQSSSTGGGDGSDYGAYVVFDYAGLSSGYLSLGAQNFADGVPTGTFETDGQGVAAVFAEAAFDRHQMPAVGKVCLLACKATNPKAKDRGLGDAFCDALAGECGKRKKAPPLVAGWDTMVTVAFPGHAEEKASGLEEGRKVAGLDFRPGKEAAKHKWVWVWGGSKYARKKAAGTGWSDAKKTPDNKVAVIPTPNEDDT